MLSNIPWRRDGAGFPLVAFPAGSDDATVPIVLDGATLEAGTVYRCPLLISDARRFSVQWQQAAAGTGTISAHRFLITNRPAPTIEHFGRPDIWSDVSAAYAFTALPSGSEASEHYPIAGVQGASMLLELTVGGANITGLSVFVQVRP